MDLEELAGRAVLALHMYKHASLNGPDFDDCRKDLCGDWHAIKAYEQSQRDDPPTRHIHMNAGDGSDSCKQCGRDLRDEIHYRTDEIL